MIFEFLINEFDWFCREIRTIITIRARTAKLGPRSFNTPQVLIYFQREACAAISFKTPQPKKQRILGNKTEMYGIFSNS